MGGSSSSRIRCASSSIRSGHGDSIAVVTFGDTARVVLTPTRATDEATILRAIDQLKPGGSTNLEAGLTLGYSLARETLLGDGGIDRIILASDGVANVGLTDANAILGQIRNDAAAGIELVSVGVGMGNYNDVLLEQLADQGDGFYAYINDLAEARRLFTEDLVGTLQTVALDAKAQVEFDPAVVATYRLIGYENRAVPDGQFRDPGVNAGAIGAGHAVTALYALTLRSDAGRDATLGTVRLRWTEPDAKHESKLDRPIRVSDLTATVRGDRADLQARRDRRGQRGGDPRRPDRDVGPGRHPRRRAPRIARPAADRPGPRLPRLPRSGSQARRLGRPPGRGAAPRISTFRALGKGPGAEEDPSDG